LILIGIIILFGDDNSGVGISSENSFIPHEVIIDELAR